MSRKLRVWYPGASIISRPGGINAVLCFFMKQITSRTYTFSKMSARSTPLFYTPIA